MNDPIRRAAVYGRTSTVSQGESLETQLVRLRVAAPGADEFVDAGISGHGVERPEFERLLEEVRDGRVDSVTVTKLDRLGRSVKTILELFNDAEAHGVRVVVLDQAIDTSTPVGRLVRTVLAAMAELEADLIAERTREAMRAFKTGARVPKGKVGHPVVATPEKVARAVALRRENPKLTWSELAQRVGLKSETVRRAVREALRAPPPDSSAGPRPEGERNAPTPEAP